MVDSISYTPYWPKGVQHHMECRLLEARDYKEELIVCDHLSYQRVPPNILGDMEP